METNEETMEGECEGATEGATEGAGSWVGAGALPQDSEKNDLIQQFSCLGTTDKDVLVKQLQKIIGPQLNSYAANFFLDMNNWNLNLAVGSYFDLTESSSSYGPSDQVIIGSTTCYSMRLLSENNVVIETPPQTTVHHSWVIQNNGDAQWPTGTHLRILNSFNDNRIDIKPLMPGESCEIRTCSSSTSESCTCTFQLCTPEGYLFGSLLMLTLNIISLDSVAQQLSTLSTHNN